MLDKLLEIGSSFDWITPLLAEIQDIANGPSHTILIPEASGWSGRQIGRMLRQHGVSYWGMMIVNHTLMLTVRQKQARWADYLLQRSGIPLLNPLPGVPNGLPGPERKTARGDGVVDGLGRFIDSIAQRLGR
jgi:hypothetical protein